MHTGPSCPPPSASWFSCSNQSLLSRLAVVRAACPERHTTLLSAHPQSLGSTAIALCFMGDGGQELYPPSLGSLCLSSTFCPSAWIQWEGLEGQEYTQAYSRVTDIIRNKCNVVIVLETLNKQSPVAVHDYEAGANLESGQASFKRAVSSLNGLLILRQNISQLNSHIWQMLDHYPK